MRIENEPQIAFDGEIECPWRELLPPRSRLVGLAPIRVGTEDCESLSAYVPRLAVAHRVTVRDLAVELVFPRIAAEIPCPKDGGQHWRERTLSGPTELAALWAKALSELTGVPSLELLTLVPWRHVLPTRELLADIDKWCPQCWADDRLAGRPVYGRLLWELQLAKACPLHRTYLQSTCWNCKGERRRGSKVAIPVIGYCHRCGCWLGDQLAQAATSDDVNRARQLGAFLACTAFLAQPPESGGVIRVLQQGIKLRFGSNVAAFARAIGRAKHAVHNWVADKAQPSLPPLLDASLVLDVPLADMLSGNVDAVTDGEPRSIALPNRRTPKPPRKIDWDQIGVALHEFSQKEPPMSLSNFAANQGLSTSQVSARCPELTKFVSAKYLEYQARQSKELLEKRFAAVDHAAQQLVSDGIKPTSKTLKNALANQFCFTGPRLWTLWSKRRSLIDTPDREFHTVHE